ncbi:MAG: hypothetical protein ACLRSE_15230 [Alistipes finegoldii]
MKLLFTIEYRTRWGEQSSYSASASGASPCNTPTAASGPAP